MQTKTAKLFSNGGSQAVRLPAEFRFEDSDEVFVRADALTGDIILSRKPTLGAWAEFFALRDALLATDAGADLGDFMIQRPLNTELDVRDVFEDAK